MKPAPWDIRVHESIGTVDPAAWDACFPDVAEDHAYLRAVEAADIKDFRWRYVTAWRDGRIVAASPAFMTAYAIDTTLDGGPRRVAQAVTSVFPKLLTMPLACLGSPVTECGRVGFHPNLPEDDHAVALRAMIREFERHARRHGCKLFGMKDVPVAQQALWGRAVRPLGYKTLPGMPTVELDTRFPSIEHYIDSLSAGTRKDMRRKLRSQKDIRIERHENIDAVLPLVFDLYRKTHDRATMRFEELTDKFFKNVLSSMAGRAFITLYYAGDALLGANLLIQNGDILLDKYFCMDDAGRDYNLYFLSWFHNVNHCLQNGLTRYHSGQSGYENKVRLGSRLVRTSMLFRHRNRIIQGVLGLASPLFAADADADEDIDKKEAA